MTRSLLLNRCDFGHLSPVTEAAVKRESISQRSEWLPSPTPPKRQGGRAVWPDSWTQPTVRPAAATGACQARTRHRETGQNRDGAADRGGKPRTLGQAWGQAR